jgi:hypothetical protein
MYSQECHSCINHKLQPDPLMPTEVVYTCENEPYRQGWLHTTMGIPYCKIFNDVAEFADSTVAMSADGCPQVVGGADASNGGWVCSQNSTQNPLRGQLVEEVQNYAQDSGETMLQYWKTVGKHGHRFGYGENVFCLVDYICVCH